MLQRINTLGIKKALTLEVLPQNENTNKQKGKLRKAETLLEQIPRKTSQSAHSHEAPNSNRRSNERQRDQTRNFQKI
jgi:hypothetical protein